MWRPGGGTQWWRSTQRGAVDFKTEDAAYFARGLRIDCLAVEDDPVGACRYPWKGGVTYGVGQGNNNPRVAQRQPVVRLRLRPARRYRGARRTRWDRRVAAGEPGTAHVQPNTATTPSNTPFVKGSPDNWGNIVRLRHAGGFTSWYFHLQADSVRVNVGDEVRQGQVIALSGNTGRSSGAHLHFQVQADSDDWASPWRTRSASPANSRRRATR